MIIAVVTPTYNEEANIEETVKRILKQQERLAPHYSVHVVIADSHSPDKTGEIAIKMSKENPYVHYVDVYERGIGVGIVEGFRYAINALNADILICMDADLSHPPEKIPEIVQKIQEGYDLVIGSRYAKGGSNNYGPYRKLQSYMGNQIIRFLIGAYDINEFLTSYRGLTSQLFKKVNLDNVPWRSKTFVFQPTFLYEMLQHNPKYCELPFNFINRRAGRSKMNTIRYIRDVLKFAIKARIMKSKQFAKFLVVGSMGFMINASILLILVEVFNVYQPLASSIGAEIAIMSNFLFNNSWTFKGRKIKGLKIIKKFLQFNLTSCGAIAIQYIVVWLGVHYVSPLLNLPSLIEEKMYILYFICAVGIGLVYNYLMYSRVIWKKQPAKT